MQKRGNGISTVRGRVTAAIRLPAIWPTSQAGSSPPDLQRRFVSSIRHQFEMGSAKAPSHLVTVTLPSGGVDFGHVEAGRRFQRFDVQCSGVYHSMARRATGIKVMIEDPLAAHRELLPKYTDADMHNVLAYLVTLK